MVAVGAGRPVAGGGLRGLCGTRRPGLPRYRRREPPAGAGGAGRYAGSFAEHYLLGVIDPAGLSGDIQFLPAGVVLGLHGVIYGWFIRRGTWGRRP